MNLGEIESEDAESSLRNPTENVQEAEGEVRMEARSYGLLN